MGSKIFTFFKSEVTLVLVVGRNDNGQRLTALDSDWALSLAKEFLPFLAPKQHAANFNVSFLFWFSCIC